MAQESFYCHMRALSATERKRYDQLREKLEGAVVETKELERGYALALRGDAVALTELAEWMESERKCCPFFDFEISVTRDGPIWLTLRGRDGVKAFMRAEFPILQRTAL